MNRVACFLFVFCVSCNYNDEVKTRIAKTARIVVTVSNVRIVAISTTS